MMSKLLRTEPIRYRRCGGRFAKDQVCALSDALERRFACIVEDDRWDQSTSEEFRYLEETLDDVSNHATPHSPITRMQAQT
jgi:hypothetical protein